MKSLFCKRTQNPRPASYGFSGRRQIGAPVAIALLEPQQVHGLVPRELDPDRAAGVQQRIPHPEGALVRNIELPAQLPDVAHALGVDRTPVMSIRPADIYGRAALDTSLTVPPPAHRASRFGTVT